MVSFNFLFLPFRRIPSTSGGSENFFFSFLGNSQKWCLSIFYFFHFVEFQAPPGDSENFFFSFLANSQKWCLSIFYFFHFVEFQAPPEALKTFSSCFLEIHRNGVFQFSTSSISWNSKHLRGLWKLFLLVSWKFTEMVSFNFLFLSFRRIPSTSRGLWKLFLFVSWKFTEMLSFNFLFLPFRRIPSTSAGSENFFFSFLGNSQKLCLSIF